MKLLNFRQSILLITLLFLSLRLLGLGADISNTDAYRWHQRSENFLSALKSGDFKGTYQHYQPGVTLMWLNSVVKQVSFSFQYTVQQNPEPLTLENSDFFPVIHGVSKAVIVLVLLALLVWQMLLLKTLFNEKVSLAFGFLVSVEPYLIGIDRWFHLTSLETYLAFTSVLLALFWYQRGNKKYLYLSAILFAVSVLAKITTFILAPVIIFIIFQKTVRDQKSNIMFLKVSSFYALVGLLTLFILFPSLLAAPLFVVQKIIEAGAAAVTDNYRNEQLSQLNRIIFYDLVLLLKLSPVILVLLAGYVKKLPERFGSFYDRAIMLMFLLYYIFLTLSDQKIDRYSIAMFPSLILLSAIKMSELDLKPLKIVLFGSAVSLVLAIYVHFPQFSSYYSPIFGGTVSAFRFGIYDNSGEYYADAARYLNQQGRDTSVFIPNGVSSFTYYYKGNLVNQVDAETDFVVSSLDLTRPEFETYGCHTLKQSFGTRYNELVRVYACN